KPTPAWVWCVGAVPVVLVLGYVCGFLHCVLTSAAAGEVGTILWPGGDVFLVARSVVLWVLCFLAGPVVFAGAAFLYWLNSGDLQPVDWLVLGELGILAVGYWIFALLSVGRRERP